MKNACLVNSYLCSGNYPEHFTEGDAFFSVLHIQVYSVSRCRKRFIDINLLSSHPTSSSDWGLATMEPYMSNTDNN